MDLNLYTRLFFDRQFSHKQPPIYIWQTLHTTVYYDLFTKKYGRIMNSQTRLVSNQKFHVTCKLFSTYNEEELQAFFDFFDIFSANYLDCQSFYLILDQMISICLNTRVLYLFTHYSMIIYYLYEEQNSPFLSKQRLIDFAILFHISSAIIKENIHVLRDQIITVEIKLGLVFLFRCLEAADKSVASDLGHSSRVY